MPITLHFNKPVSGTFTGSFLGNGAGITGVVSSSYAGTALSASWTNQAISSSYANVATSSSYAQQSFNATTASYALVALAVSGGIENAVSASYAQLAATASSVAWTNISGKPTGLVSSSAQINTGSFSGSFIGSASYANNAGTANNAATAVTASFAQRAAVAPININLNNTYGADLVITGVPVATTEWDDGQRTAVDLTGYQEARAVVRVNQAGIAGTSLGIQFSLDDTTFRSMSIAPTGPTASLAAIGTISGQWFALASESKSNVVIRWVTLNGDGATNVKLGSINFQAR